MLFDSFELVTSSCLMCRLGCNVHYNKKCHFQLGEMTWVLQFQHNYVVKMEVAKPIIYKTQVEKDIFCCLMVVVNFLNWPIGCLSFLSFFFVTCAFKSSASHCTSHCRLNYFSNFVMGWNKHVNNLYHL